MNRDISSLPTMVEYSRRLSEIYQDQHFTRPYPTEKPSFISMPWLAGIFFVLDLRTGHYLYLSEGFPDDMKNSYEALKHEGFTYFLSMMHKNDYRVITDAVFRKQLQFMQTVPKEEQGNYCFSTNFRLITDMKSYKQILQYLMVSEADTENMPLVLSGVCVDISMYKDDTRIVDSVAQLRDKETAITVYEDYYYPDEHDIEFLTSREKEIIQLIAGGQSTKEIASRLNISFHTVKAHRRNIREKTQTTNTAQLIEFGKKNGIA